MPSHIFTRVGYWKESIASNTDSARAAKEGKEFDDQLHAMDYMVYAYLQLGQDKKAKRVVDEMSAVTGINPGSLRRTVCAGVSVRRATWSNAATGRRAAELQVRPSQFAYADAMTHFARALGAARSGNPGAAKADIAKLGRAARQAARGQGRLLVRAGRHPVAGRVRLGALCRGQARRCAEGHERRRGCRGQDRKASGDAGRAHARARALRRHAARARQAQGSTRRIRGDAAKKEPNRLGATLARRRRPKRSATRPRRGNTTRPPLRSPRMPIRPGPRSRRRGRSWRRIRLMD